MMENDISWHLFEYEPPPFYDALLLVADGKMYIGYWLLKAGCFYGWTPTDYYNGSKTNAFEIKNVHTWAFIPEDFTP